MWKFQKNSPADLLNVPNRRILVTIFFSLASASCFLTGYKNHVSKDVPQLPPPKFQSEENILSNM